MAGSTVMPSAENALPGRSEAIVVSETHFFNGSKITPPYPETCEVVIFGMGCFWGAERRMWQQEGVYTTAVGYAGGFTENPTYEEVCTGRTGHTEVVLVAYEGGLETLSRLLKVFWEAHDPTQGMRQGNDIGTQYRSAIFTSTEKQFEVARASMEAYQRTLNAAGCESITTELAKDKTFYFAESYHQQYLAKNPNGYCGLKGTGVNYSAPSLD